MGKNYILAPSMLSADFSCLGQELEQIVKGGAQYVHIDVMDGAFVPNISFGIPVIKSLKKWKEENKANLIFDVHLMIEEPARFLSEFKEAGADIVTVHAESTKHLNRTIAAIKELGMKVGVALNPATPLSALDYVLDDIDMVLIMSVNPGFGGQKFIPNTMKKIRSLRDMVKDKEIDIQIDGGVNLENAKDLIYSGANVLVAGSAVFGANTLGNCKAFMELFEDLGHACSYSIKW